MAIIIMHMQSERLWWWWCCLPPCYKRLQFYYVLVELPRARAKYDLQVMVVVVVRDVSLPSFNLNNVRVRFSGMPRSAPNALIYLRGRTSHMPRVSVQIDGPANVLNHLIRRALLRWETVPIPQQPPSPIKSLELTTKHFVTSCYGLLIGFDNNHQQQQLQQGSAPEGGGGQYCRFTQSCVDHNKLPLNLS